MIDNRLKGYWCVLRGLRGAPTPKARELFAKGHLPIAITVEKDPRLRSRLIEVLKMETQQPA